MRRLCELFLILLLLAVSIISSIGCSGQTSSNNQFIEMLRLMPDTQETRKFVLIADYARARELWDITIPGPGADENSLTSYIAAVHGQAVGLLSDTFLSGMDGTYASVNPIRRKNVGFGPQDVDIVMSAGQGPMVFEIIRGRFDPERTAATISSVENPAARRRYAPETYRDVTIHSWGKGWERDLSNILAPPAFDHLGRAEPMAVLKEYAFRHPSVDGVKAMIDHSKGDKSKIDGMTVTSLGEVREYRLLAEGLWKLGAYSVFLSDQGQIASQYQEQGSETAPPLRPYQAFAWGTAKDEQGLYTALVLVHASADLAAQNVDRLRHRIEENSSLMANVPWKSLIPAAEIKSDGLLLLAKLRRPPGVRFGFEIFSHGDSLLLRETR